MILFQKLGILLSLSALTLSFSQCTSAKKTMEIKKTIKLSNKSNSEVYYQNWMAGVRGAGSGTDLYISKSAVDNKQLITAYFMNRVVDFDVTTKESSMYIARFKGAANQIFDTNMEAEAINEYGNKAPVEKTQFPFKLVANEAVVSYLENKKIMYLKLTNISKKESLAYPSAPRN